MNRMILEKTGYFQALDESAHLAASVRSCFIVPKNKKSFTGGIGLSGKILDLLLVRLRS